MTDTHSPETRSFNMSQIKSKNTKPEILVRKFLHRSGYRFRIHLSKLPGKPDIILPKYKIAILINGCFWHGHENCKFFKIPKSKTDWWQNKINNNVVRDTQNEKELKAQGWRVIKIWECALKPKERINTLTQLLDLINNIISTGANEFEIRSFFQE